MHDASHEGPQAAQDQVHDPTWLDACGPVSRRLFIAAGLVALAGCAEQKTTSALPGPEFPGRGEYDDPSHPPVRNESRVTTARTPERVPVAPPAGVLSRSTWTRSGPVPSRMNRMLPVRYITVHHDAMQFNGTSTRQVASRIEAIRRFHRNDRGWGDIGYHYVVDRAGRVWEGRSLRWQGAHVKNHNEHNIGIVALGNFDVQRPSEAQLTAVRQHVARLMATHRVPSNRVFTHQEWPTASTRCPGRNMQRFMIDIRRGGALA